MFEPAKLAGVTEIFAHRGLHVTERENTIAAFRAAADLGVQGVELDVRECADQALVVCHDAVVGGVVIGRSARGDLPGFVPTLDDALAACSGLSVNVEIKNLRHPSEPTYDESADVARRVVSAIRELGRQDSVVVSGFDLATCDVARACDDSLRVALLADWERDSLPQLDVAKGHGFQALNPHWSRVNASVVERAWELGLELNVWTVNDPENIIAMLRLGVTSLITDDPATALSLNRDF